MQKALTLIVILFLSPASRADVADEFDRYIDRMIPLTFELARNTANLREHEVLITLITRGQTEIDLATGSIEKYMLHANEITKSIGISKTDILSETFDSSSVYQQLQNHHQIRRYSQKTLHHLNEYAKIRDKIKVLCQSGFEHYQFLPEDANILIPNIESMDGVYVSIGNPFVTLLDIASSLFNLLSNNSQKSRIEKSHQRFLADRAKSETLQDYAKQACQLNALKIDAIFKHFDHLYDVLKKSKTVLDQKKWSNHEKYLFNLIRKHEKKSVQTWINQITNDSLNHNDQSDVIQNSILLVEANKILVAAKSGDCSEKTIQKNRSISAILKIYPQSDLIFSRVIHKVFELCGESTR